MKESWKITILDIVAVITVPLISLIGYMVIDELKEIRKEVNAGNIKVENHEGRISRNTSDVGEVREVLTDHTNRIIILERKP